MWQRPPPSAGTTRSLAHLVDALPPGTTWAAGWLGPFQLPMNAIAIFAGGHVRTGFEDNPTYVAQRTLPAINPGLVERVAELARIADRPIATGHEVRSLLGLPSGAMAPG